MQFIALLLAAASVTFAQSTVPTVSSYNATNCSGTLLDTWSGVPENAFCKATSGAISLDVVPGTSTRCEIDLYTTCNCDGTSGGFISTVPLANSCFTSDVEFGSYTEHTCTLPDGVNILYTDSALPPPQTTTRSSSSTAPGSTDHVSPCMRTFSRKTCASSCATGATAAAPRLTPTPEIAELHAGDKAFQDRLAMQTAWLLEHFIVHEHTPKPTVDGKNGGIILMGWSFGGASALALLADPGIVPPQLYQNIEPYLRSPRSLRCVDPPFEALGHTPTTAPELYNAFAYPEYTTFDAKFATSSIGSALTFPHSDIASADATGMFVAKAPTESADSTFGRWTDEEKMEYNDAGLPPYGLIYLRESDSIIHFPPSNSTATYSLSPAMQATLRAHSTPPSCARDRFVILPPHNNLVHSGAATCYPGMWGYMASYAMYNTAQARGDSLRATTFRLLEGKIILCVAIF
ncbi:hypothetical protein B0H14DRAFT_3464600 [Mycena olivaceomarginata]|nr:hypothetical protein B0H14DRAFT_3464600 [Mycena olivaceomarginata]